MTTHDKIIAAAKEADSGFTGDESFNLGTSLVGLEAIERFYAIAFEAGRQAEREGLSTMFGKMHTWLTNIAVIATIRARSTK